MQTRLPAAVARTLAVAANVDPRTIDRAWRSMIDPRVAPPRGMAGERAKEAIQAAGLLDAAG